MAVYVLDTTTFTLLRYHHPRVTANVAAHSGHTLALSVVSVDEIMTGWQTQMRRAKTNAERATASEYLAEAVTLMRRFAILPTTETALDDYDQLLRSKLNVGGNDLRIAAVARELGATVATNNLRDFGRVPGLRVVDWSV